MCHSRVCDSEDRCTCCVCDSGDVHLFIVCDRGFGWCCDSENVHG